MQAFRLKLGLEVHAQLQAPQKLFSRAPPTFHAPPNSRVAFFDAALPGTQPKLSWSCVNLAVRAGLALNTQIQPYFSFDRKHYMYPDQPAGYQITQFYEPIAKNGYLDLLPRDFTSSSPQQPPIAGDGKQVVNSEAVNSEVVNSEVVKRIGIRQIQMEQDTGKTSYVDSLSLVDLNRANTGLIELITDPDFTSEDEAVAFVRKLQLLLRKLKVCSGEMETGAMRVDVNVSVADPEGRDLSERCEIKNLFSTSAVKHAVRAEFKRQCKELAAGNRISRETRGWDGKSTWKLRSKENATDYRYMPDPDLPRFSLSKPVVEGVRAQLPAYPDTVWDTLVAEPYNLSVVDARTLVELDGGAEFCIKAAQRFLERGGRRENVKTVGTWLVHRWLGERDTLPDNVDQFVDILLAVDTNRVSTTTAKLLIKHIAQGYTGSIDDIIREFALDAPETGELAAICQEIIAAHPDVVARIKKGKKNSIGFLLGQVMKETQGTYDPKEVKKQLDSLLCT